jgi:Class II Aldolase and Adducin N-terminal domain
MPYYTSAMSRQSRVNLNSRPYPRDSQLTHEGSFFVPPPIPKFDQTSDLIVTAELGSAVAQVLAQHKALFLVNHGIVVVGQSVEEACVAALLLEKACRAQTIAQATGAFTWTADEEALRKRAHIYTPQAIQQIWNYHCRRLASKASEGTGPSLSRLMPSPRRRHLPPSISPEFCLAIPPIAFPCPASP